MSHPSIWRQRAIDWLKGSIWNKTPTSGTEQELQTVTLSGALHDAYIAGEHARETPTEPAGNRTRLTLDVTQDVYALLSNLADTLGVSRAEVLRRGLALVAINQDARGKGQFLSLADRDDKVVTRILVP